MSNSGNEQGSHSDEIDQAYAEVEQWLLRRLPTVVQGDSTRFSERMPENEHERSLARIQALMKTLADPQRSYQSIHITGTNGKTTTARMIDSLLRALNLRTGRITSPHLNEFRERICVDGEPVSRTRFVEIFREIEPYIELVDADQPWPLSVFEIVTGMAYAAFADAPVDVAVVEVGLGGSWDATNVIDSKVAVITPISLDHTRLLGETVEDIAEEKAGIIKAGSTVVLSQQSVGVAQVLLRHAVDVGAVVAREGLEFGVLERQLAVGGQQLTIKGLSQEYRDIYLPLHGEYQAQNAACAIAAVEALLGAGQGGSALEPDVVRAAFSGVTSPGRLEVIRRGPTVLVDAAHNPGGAQATAQALTEEFEFEYLVGVASILRDKDALGVLDPFEPVCDHLVVTQNSDPRAMPLSELVEIAVEVFGEDRVTAVPRISDAIEQAITLAETHVDDPIYGGAGVLITGSVMTVAEARQLLMRGAA